MYAPVSREPCLSPSGDRFVGISSDSEEEGQDEFQVTAPPRKRREAEWLSTMHYKDQFRPPMDEVSAISKHVCRICKYCVLGRGEIGDTIVQIYEENVGRYSLNRVYEIILEFWNDFFANESLRVYKLGALTEQQHCDARLSREQASPRSDPPTPRASSKKGGGSGGYNGSKRIRGMCMDKYVTRTPMREGESDISLGEDGSGSTTGGESSAGSSDGMLAESPERIETVQPSPYYMEVVPSITQSEVHYHFTNCYREHNGYNIIFDQLHKMLDMQNVIYNNSVYLRKVRQENGMFGGETANKHLNIAAARSTARQTLKALEETIQDDVEHVDGLLKTMNGSTVSGHGITLTRREASAEMKTAIKGREAKLKQSIAQYEKLMDQIDKLYETETTDRGATKAGESERDLCINMKEAALIQSLGKTIISLNREVSHYRTRRTSGAAASAGGVPIGQSSRDYYNNLPFLTKTTTSNDVAANTRRRNAILGPASVSSTSTTTNAASMETLNIHSQLFTGGDASSAPTTKEYVPGGTGKRVADLSGPNSKRSAKSRSRFDV